MYGKVLLLVAACFILVSGDGHEDDTSDCYYQLQRCTETFNTMPHDDWYSYSDYYTCLDNVYCMMDSEAEMKRQGMLREVANIRDNWGQQWDADGAPYLTISVVSLVACLLFIFFGQ